MVEEAKGQNLVFLRCQQLQFPMFLHPYREKLQGWILTKIAYNVTSVLHSFQEPRWGLVTQREGGRCRRASVEAISSPDNEAGPQHLVGPPPFEKVRAGDQEDARHWPGSCAQGDQMSQRNDSARGARERRGSNRAAGWGRSEGREGARAARDGLGSRRAEDNAATGRWVHPNLKDLAGTSALSESPSSSEKWVFLGDDTRGLGQGALHHIPRLLLLPSPLSRRIALHSSRPGSSARSGSPAYLPSLASGAWPSSSVTTCSRRGRRCRTPSASLMVWAPACPAATTPQWAATAHAPGPPFPARGNDVRPGTNPHRCPAPSGLMGGWSPARRSSALRGEFWAPGSGARKPLRASTGSCWGPRPSGTPGLRTRVVPPRACLAQSLRMPPSSYVSEDRNAHDALGNCWPEMLATCMVREDGAVYEMSATLLLRAASKIMHSHPWNAVTSA